MSKPAFIDYVRIRGFRSLADVELAEIPRAAGSDWRQRIGQVEFHSLLRNAELDARASQARRVRRETRRGRRSVAWRQPTYPTPGGRGLIANRNGPERLSVHAFLRTSRPLLLQRGRFSDSTAVPCRRKHRGNTWKAGIKKPRLSGSRSPANLMMSTPSPPE